MIRENILRFQSNNIRNSIASQISNWIICICLILTILGVCIQFFVEYNHSMSDIYQTIDNAHNSQEKIIKESLWLKNEVMTKYALEGILSFPYIEYTKITAKDGQQLTLGKIHSKKTFVHKHPLVKEYQGQAIVLGDIEVVAGLDLVQSQLLHNLIRQLFFLFFWSLLLGLAILILFHRKVGIHLKQMSDYASSLSIHNLDQPLTVDRVAAKKSEEDEIALLASALNTMRKTLHESLSRLKEQESQLRESQERYTLAMKASQDGLYDWDLKTDKIFFSTGWKRMLGYNDNEISNELSVWEKLTAKEDMSRALEVKQRLIANQEDRFESEFQMQHKDGHWVDIFSRANIYYDELGQAKRMVGTHVDISERNQAARQLRDVLQFNEKIVSESPVGVSIYEAESGRCIAANDAIAKLVGGTRDEVLKQNYFEIKSWRKSGLFTIAEEVIKHKTPQQKTVEVTTSFGKFIGIECYFTQFSFGGKQHLFVTSIDVTQRLMAEKAIIEQGEKAERYLNLAGVMFIGLDPVGNINVANEKACQILETNQEELLGQNWIDNFIPEERRRDIQSVFKQIIQGDIEPVEYYENAIISSSGKKKFIAWHNTVIKNTEGDIVGILSSGEDITEKRQLQLKLQQAQKMESIGTLAGGIAHDFNNILSSIIGFSELALNGVEKGSVAEEDIQEVLNAGVRAKDLVKQILTFARQSDELVKPIQVNTITKEVLKFLKSSIPSNIEIRERIESDSYIMGSPTQVHQILMNLCTNGAQAMENDGGILDICLEDVTLKSSSISSEVGPGKYVLISVKDTGTGISPQNITTIFEPYFTTKGLGDGTGMGLAVVHGIVESYGGTIKVNSVVNEGTTFSVYLPVTAKKKKHSGDKDQRWPSGDEHILFVDDESTIALVGKRTLEQLGYSVTTCTSSVEALKLFGSKPESFDLLITDMTMPNMTGDKLAVEVMKIRPEIPVIICTGYSKSISEESVAELGIKALVYKPIVKGDFASTVRSVLDGDQAAK